MSEQEQPKLASRREQSKLSQSLIWATIAAVALVGIGLIGILFCWITDCDGPPPVAGRTDTPSPTRGPIVTILAIKSKAELATVEYNTVVEINKEGTSEGLFGGKEELLMLVYGSVQAGFDLEKLEDKNLWTDGTRVRLILPAPEILNSSIDFERTHIVSYKEGGFFSENNPDLQREALAEAEKLIKEAALGEGVLERANDYGQLYYENFLRSLGFTEVEVVVDAQIFEE